MKHSRRYNDAQTKITRGVDYSLDDAIKLVKEVATAKFDETVEVTVRLGVDPRHADQVVRGTVTLPHGTGKDVRVLVIAKGAKATEAEEAGADFVGFDDVVTKIQGGWYDFDVMIATPDVMAQVGKLGRVLGPRGLMPNPKAGTVTMEVAKAVQDVKAGKIEFRVDKYGILHVGVGKVSFDPAKLEENIRSFLDVVQRLRPPAAKGQYVRSVTLGSTMGPGVRVDRNSIVS
ncbi:MAG: 50S ribosomal protein L1 [Deferribacteres bacterium]|nr:50S ribosomal protein L1 [Deferribacteres bacterium]